jgi:hypothetical protein
LVAEELGISKDDVQIHIENTLADSEDISPCHSYARLVDAAAVLRDPEQGGLAALAKVVSEFASPETPISEELLASISQALAINRDIEGKPHYTLAGQWLDAFVEYFGILNTQIRWSADESTAFIMGKYVAGATESSDVNLMAFLHLQLQAVGGS